MLVAGELAARTSEIQYVWLSYMTQFLLLKSEHLYMSPVK
jgi:hypothetical protein